ncbi:MAG: hypothetical protein WKF77_03410 [Planctomycetaceae bacterium]
MSLNDASCLVPYEGHGITFEYPGYWEISEEVDDTDVLITVLTDNSCFWALRILHGCPRPDEVVNSCIEAFKEEYDEAEVTESGGVLAEMPAFCREVEFSCFELLNSVALSSVRSSKMTLLVWWQGTDHELESTRPILDRMTQSVRILDLL